MEGKKTQNQDCRLLKVEKMEKRLQKMERTLKVKGPAQ